MLTGISIIGTAVTVALLVIFAIWAAQMVDAGRLSEQQDFARAGLHEFLDRVPKEQESITLWDDAVLKLRARDTPWIEENLGVWMYDYFGHDEVYVLDPANAPVYAMEKGRTIPADRYSLRAALIDPLVRRLRNLVSGAMPGADLGRLGASDIMLEDGIPAFVSVKPVVPTTAAVVQPQGTEYLHVSIRLLDQALLDEIAAHFRLKNLHLVGTTEADSGATVSVTDGKGRLLGFVGWTADRPGQRLLTTLTPGVALFVGVFGLLMLILLVRTRRAAADLSASEAQTRFLAFHDTLTGLANRAMFEERIDRLIADRRGGGHGIAVHVVDIDRFKSINDTLGHPAGDEMIRQAASRLLEATRDDDLVARLGGDEFAVVQTWARSPADAEGLAGRLVETLARPYMLAGKVIYSSGSVGTLFSPVRASERRDDLMRRADIALYEAKGAGRGRYTLFTPEMDDRLRERHQVEEELRVALELGEQIGVVYQPLFAADGKTVVGCEALARWMHPTRGELTAADFVPLAEENGLIETLGETVLREAASFARDAQVPFVAVNVSPMQFRSERFSRIVMRVLADVGLPAQRLQIEITERVLLEGPDLVLPTLRALREAGVRVALGDVGTGYSSMRYLRDYTVDKLKLDKSFVAEVGSSTDADAIIRAMVALARSMRMGVTAEGIETQEQMERLVALGCAELQGFLLGTPMSRTQMLMMLAQPPLPQLRA